MHAQNDFAAIAAIDLQPIKMKLMHRRSGEGWSQQKADSVELEYRRFLYLMKKYPSEPSAPLLDVDTFWHYHILDTMKYMADCDAVFGYYLHHYPYAGMEGREDDEEVHQQVGQRMQQLYEQEFGQDAFAMAMRRMGSGQDAGADDALAWCVAPPAVMPAQAEAAAASAWCVAPPATRMARLPQTDRGHDAMRAWCVAPPATRMAWCVAPPAAPRKTVSATAWCVAPPSAPRKTVSATAWCVAPPAAPAKKTAPASAWCVAPPAAPARKTASATAWCVAPPAAPQGALMPAAV